MKFLFLALVVLALTFTSFAQEDGSLDLAKIEARVDLRRPEASSPITSGYSGMDYTRPCSDSTNPVGILQTSLVSLDGTRYQVEDEPTFEARIENIGSTPVRIPFSPHLADLQPKDPAQKFAYSELYITLWIAGGETWKTNSGGGVTLYGTNRHPNTMLTLKPGEWVRIIGKGHLFLDNNLFELIRAGHPPDRVYAVTSLVHKQTLITPTQSATTGQAVCLAGTLEQSVPIELTIP
jgi:hypothetical protein